MRLELTRPCDHYPLKVACIPISPPAQGLLKSWAENGTRTRDPNLGKVVLYQLSYFRKFLWILRDFCFAQQFKWTWLFSLIAKIPQRVYLSFADAKLLLFFDMTKYFCEYFYLFDNCVDYQSILFFVVAWKMSCECLKIAELSLLLYIFGFKNSQICAFLM